LKLCEQNSNYKKNKSFKKKSAQNPKKTTPTRNKQDFAEQQTPVK